MIKPIKYSIFFLMLILITIIIFSQTVFAACGDSVLDDGELCDDNNTANGDGCNDVCISEPDVCEGNFVDGDFHFVGRVI